MDPVVDVTVRIGLGLLLGTAAVHKLSAFGAFRATLADYRLLPAWLTAPASVGLVAIECLAAAAVPLPRLARPGLVVAAVLLVVYAAAIGINLTRGRRHIDCGCFGAAARRPIHPGLVVRNLLLASVAVAALTPVTVRPLVWVDAATIAAALGTVVALHLALDQMLAEAPRLRALRSEA